MNRLIGIAMAAGLLACSSLGATSQAADYPAPRDGDWVAKDFRFHTGDVLPELRLHYTTIGDPSGQPVLILHGTNGSGPGLLTPGFAGDLFGPGQPLDASKYYIILPDSIGHGKSAKPSDGLRAKFPSYNYDDMVSAQYRLVTEGLNIRHLRLVLGFSMGGMNAWIWGGTYPDTMDALVPMASQPAAMSSRNWMMRRLVIDAIRNDPEWKNGDYTAQPKAFRSATVYYLTATNGGSRALQKAAPTREAADKLLDARLAAASPTDANDLLYQYEASRDYDPGAKLESIKSRVLAINSADDERNPPESGLTDAAIAKIPGARLYLIPPSAETRGHGTTGMAKFWQAELARFLASVPSR